MNLHQPDSNLSVYLIIDSVEYQLSQFKIGYIQSTSEKGEPLNRVRGGAMTLKINQILPDSLYCWAFRTEVQKDGVIAFRNESESAPLRIEFKNAYCVGFYRSVDSLGGGITSVITISPEETSVNGIDFFNYW